MSYETYCIHTDNVMAYAEGREYFVFLLRNIRQQQKRCSSSIAERIPLDFNRSKVGRRLVEVKQPLHRLQAGYVGSYS